MRLTVDTDTAPHPQHTHPHTHRRRYFTRAHTRSSNPDRFKSSHTQLRQNVWLPSTPLPSSMEGAISYRAEGNSVECVEAAVADLAGIAAVLYGQCGAVIATATPPCDCNGNSLNTNTDRIASSIPQADAKKCT